MSHSARQAERDTLQQFIDDSMNDLMASSDTQKMDLICDLVYEKRIQINDILEYFEEDVINYYSEQRRPR